MQQDPSTPDEYRRSPRSAAEWLTFGLSSLILGTIVGLVIYSWATEGDRPPTLTVRQTDSIRQENGQFYIPFEVVNTGGQTAESVQVIAELRKNNQVEESGDLQIDFLAQDETEKGAFVFQENPRNGELTLRIGSYKVP
jgi:uncharacterized protein (TIGR02588 family)